MQIAEVRKFEDLVKDTEIADAKLILDPRATANHPIEKRVSSVVLIGPEGGFSENELELAADRGWKPVSLGPAILRMETAALAVAVRISE